MSNQQTADIELLGFNDKGEAIVRENGIRQELNVEYVVGNSIDYDEKFRMKVYAQSRLSELRERVNSDKVNERIAKQIDVQDGWEPKEYAGIAQMVFLDLIDELTEHNQYDD